LQFEADINGKLRQVVVRRAEGRFIVEVNGRPFFVDAQRVGERTLSLLFSPESEGAGGISREVTVSPNSSGQLDVHLGGAPVMVTLNGRRRWNADAGAGHDAGPERVVAPMPGKVVRMSVRVGDSVALRQPLAVIEAMKMENELRAKRPGIVTEVHAREGQSVEAGALLVVIADEKQ
jgi:biotin carboxyl carrier protein